MYEDFSDANQLIDLLRLSKMPQNRYHWQILPVHKIIDTHHCIIISDYEFMYL